MAPVPEWLKPATPEPVAPPLPPPTPTPPPPFVLGVTPPPVPVVNPPPPPTPPPLTSTQVDDAALKAASDAGVVSPATISDTTLPSPSEMHMRLQALEGLVTHWFNTYARGVNLGQIVDAWIAAGQTKPVVLDETVKGRP